MIQKYMIARVALVGLLGVTSAMSEDLFLKAKHSDKCAQVDRASQANGANISQYDCVNYDNVIWSWVEVGSGYVFLKAKHSGKCAQVDGASQANGANISQWDCVDQDNVKWGLKLLPSRSAEKYYNIVNKGSGKCLQVDGASTANNANISQYDCLDQDNVKWRLVRVPVGASVPFDEPEAFDLNGFSLSVARSDSLSDLIFSWKSRSSQYEKFNVRVRISDGREGQVELAGGTYGSYRERNAVVGRTYTFLVQGCDSGTFSSKCTPWSQVDYRNVRQ